MHFGLPVVFIPIVLYNSEQVTRTGANKYLFTVAQNTFQSQMRVK